MLQQCTVGDYTERLLKSKAYICRVVRINTLCLCQQCHRNKLPWRYPSFSDGRSPVEQLFWNPPENNSLLSVAIILHVLLTEANVGIAQWVLQPSFIPKAILSVFSLSKSPGMQKFTIIYILLVQHPCRVIGTACYTIWVILALAEGHETQKVAWYELLAFLPCVKFCC